MIKESYRDIVKVNLLSFAINRGYEILVQMDADNSHSVLDLEKLLEFKKYSDVVIGVGMLKMEKLKDGASSEPIYPF